MEIIVLIFIIIAFSRAAEVATRSRLSWAAFGGLAYIGSLVLFQVAFAQVFPPSSKFLPVLVAIVQLLSNLLAMIVVIHLGCYAFGNSPIDFSRLARILNIVWLVGTVFLLFSSISLIISGDHPVSYYHIGLFIWLAIPAVTMFIYMRKRKGVETKSFLMLGTIAANLIAALIVVFYLLTLRVSQPIAFPLVEAYYGLWLAITAFMNVFALRGYLHENQV